jgi:hypothetical protein
MKVINRVLHIAALAAVPTALATQSSIQAEEESSYGVDVFECNNNLEELAFQDRQVKTHEGSVIRVCFRPNHAAMEDGVRIRSIDEFIWYMEHANGVAQQTAVQNGQVEPSLSQLECLEGGTICVLDTMLTGNFYFNEGSVLGTGHAFLTGTNQPILLKKWMFQAEFKYEFKEDEFKQDEFKQDDELTPEEEEELMRLYQEQIAALSESEAAEVQGDETSQELPSCTAPTCAEGDAAQMA